MRTGGFFRRVDIYEKGSQQQPTSGLPNVDDGMRLSGLNSKRQHYELTWRL